MPQPEQVGHILNMDGVEPLPTKPPPEYQYPGHRRETTLTLAGWQRIIRENFTDHWTPTEIAQAYEIKNMKNLGAWEELFSQWVAQLEGWNDSDLQRAFNVYVESKERFSHREGQFVPPQPAHLKECLTELNLRRMRLHSDEDRPKRGRINVVV